MITTTLFLALAILPAANDSVPPHKEAVLLDDYGPCGITSLFLVCKLRDVSVTWEQIQELVGPATDDGSHSFADLSRAASALGLHPVGLKVNRAALKDLPMPAIVQVTDPSHPSGHSHLLVVVRPEPDGVTMLDPPYPAYYLPDSRFTATWTGNVLVFAKDEAEAQRIRSAAWVNLWSRIALVGIPLVVLLAGLWFGRHKLLAGSRSFVQSLAQTPRRKVLRFALLGLLVAATVVIGYPYWRAKGNAASPASCQFEQSVIELGEVAVGEFKQNITIHNPGTAPLVISDIDSSCTCAVGKAPETIEPGGSATLEVSLSIPPGPRSAKIAVHTNDPQGPKTVVLYWWGKAPLELVPFKIDVQGIPSDKPYERTLHFVYAGGKTAFVPELLSWECDSPLVEVRAGKSNPMAARYARAGMLMQVQGETELHFKIRPPNVPGWYHAKCHLTLKYGESTSQRVVPITIYFVDEILKPEPSAVVFSAENVAGLKDQVRVIQLGKRPTDNLTLEGVPPWLKHEWLRHPDGETSIQLKMIGDPPTSLTQHTLQIVSGKDSPARTPLQVNVFAPK